MIELLRRAWDWIATCAENGCREQPAHLGWCVEHAPEYVPVPDEYWGDW